MGGKGTPSGVVSLRLPSTVLLKAGKDYNYYFLVYCDVQNQDKFVYVNGLVRRVKRPALEKQLVLIQHPIFWDFGSLAKRGITLQ
ncbi:DUF928 domain-containing protein [Nostoc sp. WHI]|nr:DUF928 domain-containing protein [Nostoc sp. WHI]